MHPECLSKHHKQECPICRRPQTEVKVTGKLEVMMTLEETPSRAPSLIDTPHPFWYSSEVLLEHPEEWEREKLPKKRYEVEDEEFIRSLSDAELLKLCHGTSIRGFVMEHDDDSYSDSESYLDYD